MRAKAIAISTAVACLILAIGACSSGSGGSSYSLTNCPGAGISGTSSCTTCEQSQCANQLSAAQNACSASDLDCACDPSSHACMNSQGCAIAGGHLVGCIMGYCAAACRGGG